MKAIIELQKRAMDSSTDIVELVRYAYAIATELEIKDFANWCNAELEGYLVHSNNSIPKYRYISGTLMFSRSIGNPIPVNCIDRNFADQVQIKLIPDDLSTLQGLVKNYKSLIPMDLNHDIKQILIKQYNTGVENHFESVISSLNMENDIMAQQILQSQKPMIIPYLSVDCSQIKKIFGAVQTCIFKWTLECKNKGILGEEWIFTKEEKEMAKRNGIEYYL